MLPGDRLICALTEPRQVGFSFKDWLLHVTVVPWFRVEIDTLNLVIDLRQELAGVAPFQVVIGEENVRFGHQKSKLAAVVQSPTSFAGIESRVRGYLRRQHAWLVDETTKSKRDFRAHITAQKSGALRRGDRFSCASLYIIEQKGVQKEIIGEVRFGER